MIDKTYTKDKVGSFIDLPETIKESSKVNYNISEYSGLLYYIPKIEKVKNILEIGTGYCISTIPLAQAAFENNGILVTIDNVDRTNKLKEYTPTLTNIIDYKIDSHEFSGVRKIISKLNIKTFDLIFIDGDHSYEGVKKDFEFYTTYLSDNGIVIMHDISLIQTDINVNKFWNEIDTTKYDKFPMFASNGLGLVRLRAKAKQ